MLKTVPAFDRIGEENAFAVLARANALIAQGRDVINLGIGQPDFRTPEFIVEAAVKALRDGHHGYTPAVGIPPLREAVAADLHKRFKVSVSPDEVMILPGGKPTMFMSILMFGEPGRGDAEPDHAADAAAHRQLTRQSDRWRDAQERGRQAGRRVGEIPRRLRHVGRDLRPHGL
jgi:aspartate aminotransferase